MTLETLQAVKFGGSKGGPGVSTANYGSSWCHGAKAGAGRWRTVVAKRTRPRGEWGGASRQHRRYSCHRQSFESATDRWWILNSLCEYPFLEKLHFHVPFEEVRVTELLSLILVLIDVFALVHGYHFYTQ